ncbi:sigma-54-dependent transcriptional regulator [Pseudoalteromonas denitrificans]|uniref:DNA-binding transcriptional response regulator, NtrC family, contains REC, AAA-type ATPase, and a Fis-type DNA-binding domains n=1 Tax=Pseudoalteromonas denitrificans DSM 6059 TaxID=1123010 RepID=A0A1I1MZC2_9GAMM|nr:sigma-54 dependent transcriptional regulator [Pseudoalteromonas denitrificans]SFC90525.1 DNA-binding transcriptional response regulator, NtrC family, contains REC, AAA-type ATPase, and a Fis-type DNA-binding domains [Pseudoalteromonas denitrificans DSM 6059]
MHETNIKKYNATILLADDDEDIRLALALLLMAAGYQTIEASNAKEVIIQTNRQKPDLILLDMNFSRDTTSGQEGLDILSQLKQSNIPIILMTAWGSIELAVNGLKQGACDFIEKPWNKEKLLNSILQQLNFSKIKQEHQGYRQLLSSDQSQSHKIWICQSQAMKNIEQLVTQIAPTDANVLILGENGTGKSQLAERIHQLSARQKHPLIAVNMAAIPDNLFESELFGHQKGAFTDAKQNRIGRFQLADQGTLFFDEIGSLPITLQPKLLRVLETGQYEVLGSSQTQVSNVRLISATNADLSKQVSEGAFRQDLLYRLNTLVITLPPLRERLNDIQPLAENFIDLFSIKYRKSNLKLTPEAINKLKQHNWPGNIRELGHTMERAVLLSMTNEINQEQLLLDSADNDHSSIQLQPLEQAERQLIEKAMTTTSGQVIEAAKLLDISRNALYRRLEKFGIKYES